MLAFAQQCCHRHAQVLSLQVEQGRLDGGDRVDGGAQVEGLQPAAARVAVGEVAAHLRQHRMQVTDAAPLDQRAGVFQRLPDGFAAGHLADPGATRAVGNDDQVAREEGRVRARQVQQHAVAPGNRDRLQRSDDRRVEGAHGRVGLEVKGRAGASAPSGAR